MLFPLLRKKCSINSLTSDDPTPDHITTAQPHQSIPNCAHATEVPLSNNASGDKRPSLAQTMQHRVQALTERASLAVQANRTGIPDRLKEDVENRSGLPLDDVQVHYNSDKPTQFDALAYTQGN